MKIIVILGDSSDRETRDILLETIQDQKVPGIFISDSDLHVILKNHNPKFLLLDTLQIPASLEPDLIIIKEGYRSRFPFPEGTKLVVDSNNTYIAEKLKDQNNDTVTCGLSAKDTITFSSINADHCAISLQRNIYDMYGQLIEPCEFILHTSENQKEYAILSAAAALILLGFNLKNGRNFYLN